MRRTAAVLCGLLALAAAPGCSRGGGDGARPASPTPVREVVAVDPNSTAPADRALAAAQQRLRERPGDADAELALANAFLAKARETGDPTFYARADEVLGDLTRRRPADAAVLAAAGELALARHRFDDAFALGQRAVAEAPGMVAALGVMVDAANELGRYDEALDLTQRMADSKPNLASLSRVSYARELRGDVAGAVTAMQQAVLAGEGAGEALAYTQVQLGNLLLATGDTAGAAAAYADAERAFPGFALPPAGRAKVLVASGDPHAAAALLHDVVERLPTAEHAAALGDALTAAGDGDGAADAYALVGAIAAIARDNGVDVDLDLALFDAEHDPGRKAVGRARRALAARPSVFAHDAVAWNLFRAGDEAAAAKEIVAALALGTRDPQIRFHAAAIAFAVGDRDAAAEHLRIVLAGNPRFSARHAPEVAALADALGLGPVPPPAPPCPPSEDGPSLPACPTPGA